MSALFLGLLLPFGAGAIPDQAAAMLTKAAIETPLKQVIFIDGHDRMTVKTRAATVDLFLRERGIVRRPEDALSNVPDAAVLDGATISYQPAVPVSLAVDGEARSLRTAARSVGGVLAEQHVAAGPHDTVVPARSSGILANSVIQVKHATSWLERIRTAILPPVTHKYDLGMTSGSQRVIDPGALGTKETTIEVLQANGGNEPRRFILAARVLRLPRARVVAEGVGDFSALAAIARRGMAGTARLADAALRMVATAYTGACSGCSGMTALGRPAGHGVVAVDPHYIPLGTHLFIPGYGHALAGDTGGSIRGNRIDLGFDSARDAMSFGRRPVVVYVFK